MKNYIFRGKYRTKSEIKQIKYTNYVMKPIAIQTAFQD